MSDLDGFIKEIEEFINDLKLPGFMGDLKDELSKDFRYARDRAIQVMKDFGLEAGIKNFKYNFRSLAFETMNEFWSACPWYIQLLKPFVMPFIMRGFRAVWKNI